MSIDDETLMAFADGELPPHRVAEVEAAVAADPTLAARVARFRLVRTKLAGALDGAIPTPSLMERARRAQAVRERLGVPPWAGAVAASFIGVAVGVAVTTSWPSDTLFDDRGQARGVLAAALDSAASGASSRGRRGREVAVLYTVVAKDGRPCRAFREASDGYATEGVACRDGEGWKMLIIAAGRSKSGGFAQASGDEPAAVTAALDALEPGDPLSAEAESRLIGARWKSAE